MRLVFGSAIAAAVIIGVTFAPLESYAWSLAAWLRGAGAAGVAAFAAVYVVAAVAMAPGSILTAVAGFVYGPVIGVLLVSPVSVLAATICFALGRGVARPAFERRVASSPRLAALDRAVGGRAFVVVLLLRLSPVVPYTLLNYVLGVTRVRPRTYVLASWLGMLPGTVLYVYAGSAVTRLGEAAHGGGGWRDALYAGGLIASVAMVWALARAARGELRRAEAAG